MATLTKDIRNIALVGHSATGKTLLADAFLLNAGTINRLGSVQEGTTTSDYSQEEIDRQISLRATLMHVDQKGVKLNLLDTPGYMDFSGELAAISHIVDAAVLTVDATSNGIEVGTELAWEALEKNNVAPFFAVSMLDKEHTHFDEIVSTLQNRFGDRVFATQFPINEGPAFHAIVDVLKKKMLNFDDKGEYSEEDIPADQQGRVDELYEKLVELVAESDDALLEKYFEEGELSKEEISDGLKSAIASRTLYPLVCVSSQKNIGVSRLAEILADLAPAPATEVKAKKAGTSEEVVCKADASGPTSLFIYKSVYEQHVGEMSYFKVMTGTLKPGMDLKNAQTNTTERFGGVFTMNGKNRVEMDELQAGDIGTAVKLKDTHTCNTLCDSKNMVEYDAIQFPDPIIRVAVEASAKGDDEKIGVGLTQVRAEDPSFYYEVDSELKQTLVSGQGETHLEVCLKKIEDRYHIEINQIEPKIPYRETIRKTAQGHYRHKKQSGGAGQFGEVYLRIEPKERGEGIEFVSELVGMNVDRSFVPSVEKGVKQATVEGPLTSSKVIDIKIAFYDGKQHPVDSKDIAFQIAGRGAFREAFTAADPILLEPIYEIEIKIPEEYMGDVMGDVSSRRGKVLGMDSDGHNQMIKASVPLANLYKYANTLRSISQGRGQYRRKFSHYEYVPKDIQDKVVAEHQRLKEEANS
ncbi:MAG: elongation factor G [Candidatus Marinimicrobia bacterium]|nr:elongation factor G [Candidatus Neomarinimicrobiota bacterium]